MQRLSKVSICGSISLGRSLMISSGHLATPCDSASSTLIIERRFVFLSKARTGTAKLYATMHCREAPPVGTGRGKLAAYNQALPIEWLFLSDCHAGRLGDHPTPVGSAEIIYASF